MVEKGSPGRKAGACFALRFGANIFQPQTAAGSGAFGRTAPIFIRAGRSDRTDTAGITGFAVAAVRYCEGLQHLKRRIDFISAARAAAGTAFGAAVCCYHEDTAELHPSSGAVKAFGGYGFAFGQWCITSVQENQTIFFKDGTPRRIDFTINLKKYGDDKKRGIMGIVQKVGKYL